MSSNGFHHIAPASIWFSDVKCLFKLPTDHLIWDDRRTKIVTRNVEMKWNEKCSECVQKPTQSRLSLTHHANKSSRLADKNIKWSESSWNQSGRKGERKRSMEEMICRRAKSSEWKTERVREDASGDREDGEDDDELPCVKSESEGEWNSNRKPYMIYYITLQFITSIFIMKRRIALLFIPSCIKASS